MGRHAVRTDLGIELGATDVVADRGEESVAKVPGPAPARAYIETLLPDVLAGRVDLGKVFDRGITLDETPTGYKAMDEREVLKVLIRP